MGNDGLKSTRPSRVKKNCFETKKQLGTTRSKSIWF